MHPFEQYLQQHNLEALRVSVVAKVRYMTVYNALKNNPITPEHAQQIRAAVLGLTGVPFTGPFMLSNPVEEMPTVSLQRITKKS